MNYSELVTALKEDDSARVNTLIETLRPRLIAFLRIHMNASLADAEDCAQDSLLISIETIKEDRVKNPDQVVSYILSICRNSYLKMQKKRREKLLGNTSGNQQQRAHQLQSLLDKEQKRLLELCMNQLKKEHQKFMRYWFTHPNAHTKSVADHFDISVSSAWTRKHRLIKKLNECYQKKSNL